MYVDVICLMAPSLASLQELIDICYDFGNQNDLHCIFKLNQIVLCGVQAKII